jgi:hypothetical protein
MFKYFKGAIDHMISLALIVVNAPWSLQQKAVLSQDRQVQGFASEFDEFTASHSAQQLHQARPSRKGGSKRSPFREIRHSFRNCKLS